MAAQEYALEEKLPSYVRDQCAQARRVGMEVAVAPYRMYEDGVAVSWLGTAQQFEDLGMRVEHTALWRRPSRRGHLYTPFLNGDMKPAGDGLLLLVSPETFPIREWRSGEIVHSIPRSYTFASFAAYHGTPDALIAAGLIEQRQIPRGLGEKAFKSTRSGVIDDCHWQTKLCFDGKLYLEHCRYHEHHKPKVSAELRRRQAEDSAERDARKVERRLTGQQAQRAQSDYDFQAFMRKLTGDGE